MLAHKNTGLQSIAIWTEIAEIVEIIIFVVAWIVFPNYLSTIIVRPISETDFSHTFCKNIVWIDKLLIKIKVYKRNAKEQKPT